MHSSLGLVAPRQSAQSAPGLGDLCRRLGVSSLLVDGQALDAALGCPQPIVPLAQVTGGLEDGWLDIEADVFRDAVELAETSHARVVTAWRATTRLTPLLDWRRTLGEAGVHVRVVDWPDVSRWAPADGQYACAATAAIGAAIASVAPGALSGGHLETVAAAAGVRLGVTGLWLPAADEAQTSTGRALDLAVLVRDRHARSILDLLEAERTQITHLVIADVCRADGRQVPIGSGDAPVIHVLEAHRRRAWPFPLFLSVPGTDSGTDEAEMARGLAACRAGLGL